MGQIIMEQAKQAAVRAYSNGARSFMFMQRHFAIEHAHDNEYMVLLPDGSQIFRIIQAEQIHLLVV